MKHMVAVVVPNPAKLRKIPRLNVKIKTKVAGHPNCTTNGLKSSN